MAVVVPSECLENNPLTVLEAFALGKPVIGSKIGGIPELVTDHKIGFNFKSGDIDSLKEKIFYITDNCDKIIELGKNARKFVEENFNPDRFYEKLMLIYKNVIKLYN